MIQLDLPPKITCADDIREALVQMTESGGSDLFVMGGDYLWVSRYGRKEQISKRRLTDKEVEAILTDNEVYGSNAPALLGSAVPINSAYEISHNGERLRYRLNAVGCLRNGRTSITTTLRTIPTTPPPVSALAVHPTILDTCRQSDQGLICVVGATGHGKSTTLAAILRDLVEDPEGHKNLVTIEEPIEFVYDGVEKPNSLVTQMEVGRFVGSFADGVKNSLRMAPTTILVGESRDYLTISASVEASITGHVVFTTVHANSVVETIQRMIAVYPQDLQNQAKQDILQALKMVVAQRLIPSLDGKRVALREFILLNSDEDKRILAEATSLTSAVTDLLWRSGQPMAKSAREAYEAGLISKEWMERVFINYGGERHAA